MSRKHQVGVGLVIAKQNVVARAQCFNQIVFENQRLGLGACDRDLDTDHARHHMTDTRARGCLLKIRGHPLF